MKHAYEEAAAARKRGQNAAAIIVATLRRYASDLKLPKESEAAFWETIRDEADFHHFEATEKKQ